MSTQPPNRKPKQRSGRPHGPNGPHGGKPDGRSAPRAAHHDDDNRGNVAPAAEREVIYDDDDFGNRITTASHEKSAFLTPAGRPLGIVGAPPARRGRGGPGGNFGTGHGNGQSGRRNREGGSQIPELDGPERLQKVLAHAGFASRREVEEWVQAGRISVNGEPAHLGQKVGPDDKVRVNGKLIQLKFRPRLPRVMLYHKPEGEIVSRDDPEGRPSVFAKLPRLNGSRWVAVGRLDFNTSGLLIFCTDGELANRLMHPRHGFEREYSVRLLGQLESEQRESLLAGIELEDGLAKLNSISDGGGEGSNHWYNITLSEGRNREVRRIFDTLKLTVSRLIRVRFGPVSMPPRLKRGTTMDLPEAEVATLLSMVGMNAPGKPGQPKRGGKPPKKTGAVTTPPANTPHGKRPPKGVPEASPPSGESGDKPRKRNRRRPNRGARGGAGSAAAPAEGGEE